MKVKKVVIEKGNGQIPSPKTRPEKYPFTKMEIGDSFIIECTPDMVLKTRQRLISSAHSRVKYHGLDRKFSARTEETGVRIYRVK